MEYVDLLLIHWPVGDEILDKNISNNSLPLYKVWAKFEEFVERGLVKSIGVSNFNCQLILDMLTYAKIKPAVN